MDNVERLRVCLDGQNISPMTRLLIVGSSGKGALEYLPEYPSPENTPEQDLDMLAEESMPHPSTETGGIRE